MREQIHSNEEIAKAVKASGVVNAQYVVLDRFFFCIDARIIGVSPLVNPAVAQSDVVKRTSDSESYVPHDLEQDVLAIENTKTAPETSRKSSQPNSEWVKEKIAAAKWLQNHIKNSGQPFLQIAEETGMSSGQLRKYLEDPIPLPVRRTIQKIQALRKRTEANAI